MLDREANMLARLRHNNIAKVLDHFSEDGRHYLMLEYINGQDLRQFVKQNGVLPEDKAVAWGLKILEILSVLHEQQPPIIHRDLTPDNLVVTNQGEIVLIDFGAANLFVGNATGTIVGKQAYIAAEQLRGHSMIESDIYSFGGTMYYLLTGKDPLPLAESRPALVNQSVHPLIDDVIGKCSAFEPEQRWHSAREVASALTHAANHRKQLTASSAREGSA
jgi:serine/threonine-protein kinase